MRALLFPVKAVAWSLGIFAFLRHPWVEERLVLPLTLAQERAAVYLGGGPDAGTSILVTAACSGADVLALCVGVIFACPVSWRRRLAAALSGLAMILALNTLRIATLGRAASSPALFGTLHEQVWPAVFALAIAGYVLTWMRVVLRPGPTQGSAGNPGALLARFAPRALVLLVGFALCGPWIAGSAALVRAGGVTAEGAARILTSFGTGASAEGNVLTTARGSFMVTPECLATALIPLYVAGVLAARLSWGLRLMALGVAPILFAALAMVRLMLLALPPVLAPSPLLLVHGFHQGVFALIALALLILWRAPGRSRGWKKLAARGAGAALAGVVVALTVSGPLSGLVLAMARGLASLTSSSVAELATSGDAQGALATLPGFQTAFLFSLALAASLAWRRLAAGLVFLVASQVLLLVVLGGVHDLIGLTAHPLFIRAWATGLPIGLTIAMLRDRSPRAPDVSPAYRRFWHDVGETFPDLGGAVSTAYYLENEKRLLTEHVPDLATCRMLKTDLWDEVKNTRILQWVRSLGATVYGVDISGPTVLQARAAFPPRGLNASVSDVRILPFQDGSFDAIYSMGTIEHFADPETALREMFRVLRPGGRAVIGVPNRFDPFLRPALAFVMQRMGIYGYGYERSFSRRAFRRMLEASGFQVLAETGILFIPGWLRMADLLIHTRAPWLSPVTGFAVRLFVWIDRHVAGARRHGYLLASVGQKPLP